MFACIFWAKNSEIFVLNCIILPNLALAFLRNFCLNLILLYLRSALFFLWNFGCWFLLIFVFISCAFVLTEAALCGIIALECSLYFENFTFSLWGDLCRTEPKFRRMLWVGFASSKAFVVLFRLLLPPLFCCYSFCVCRLFCECHSVFAYSFFCACHCFCVWFFCNLLVFWGWYLLASSVVFGFLAFRVRLFFASTSVLEYP